MTYDTGPMRETQTPEQIAAGLTKAQRKAVMEGRVRDCHVDHPANTRCPNCAGWPFAKGGALLFVAAVRSAAKSDLPSALDTIDAQAGEIARLREAAQAVIERWHLLTWREAQPTAQVMDALVAALKETNNG